MLVVEIVTLTRTDALLTASATLVACTPRDSARLTRKAARSNDSTAPATT